MGFSKTIQMLIFDGNPNGRIMCELSNWNGRVYKISRNELSKFVSRDDAENTGVYFLFGKDENNNDTVYIGEAEKMLTRLKQHLNDENYWNDCIAVISKDNLLNKAHVKFLEHKFYTFAQQSSRAIIINSTVPTCSSISEYDEEMLYEFIENTKLLVNTLGYKVFDIIKDQKNNSENSQADNIYYIKSVRNSDAIGTTVSDGFDVFKGSTIASSTSNSISPNLIKIRNNLIDNKIINNDFKFTQNYHFTSPSTAAAIVMGRNANGRTEWKRKDGKSIKDIEENV